MSAGLTETAPVSQPPRWLLLRDVAVVLVAAALVGTLAGVLWESWWEPPTGLVLDHVWYPDLQGVKQLFSGTSRYVVVGLVGGVLLGAVSAWFFHRVELVTLVAVAVGSVLAGWLMVQVGSALSPPDPAVAARTSEDYTELPGTLEIEGRGALVAFPAGALTGLAVVFIGLTPSRRFRL